MKRALLLSSLLAACGSQHATIAPDSLPGAGAETPAAAAAATPAGKGTLATKSFHSDALGVDKSYLVYLPAGYEGSSARYPVIYMLNGLGGDETNWTEHGHADQVADSLGLQAIIVFPDGDSSFYTNSVTTWDYDACVSKGKGVFGKVADPKTFCVRTPNYEDYIVKDLVGHIDATYRTVAQRGARGITGLSMGGFGALQLAMRHTDVFGSTASHSGVDTLLYGGPWPYVAAKATLIEDVSKWGAEAEPIGAWVRSLFGPDRNNWVAHDPALLAANLKAGALAIYLDAGTADDFGLNAGAAYLHDVLDKAHIPHAYTVVEGGRHNFSLWSTRIDDSLEFHRAAFARAGLPTK